MKVGFTGTQKGMNEAQYVAVERLMSLGGYSEAHHGDCVGADFDFHQISQAHKVSVVVHPPDNNQKRAFCEGADKVLEPKPYLKRNHDIVDAVDVLIATPKGEEEELRSGTWATIRYARKRGTKIKIVFPSGKILSQTP